MKELLCVVERQYSNLDALVEHIKKNTIYKELSVVPNSNAEYMSTQISKETGDYLYCVTKAHTALALKGNLKNVKVVVVYIANNMDAVQTQSGYSSEKDILRITAIERLTVSGLSSLIDKHAIDILLDGSLSLKQLLKQFDSKLKSEDFMFPVLEDVDDTIDNGRNERELVYKCSINLEQAKALVDKGMRKFELHTDDRFICDPDAHEVALGLLDILPDIVSIHTPLDNMMVDMSRTSCTIGMIDKDKVMRKAVKSTMKLAQICAEKYGHRVSVIMHNEDSLNTLFIWNNSESVLRLFTKLLKKYPMVDICLENTTPMEKLDGFSTTFHGGVFSETAEIVQVLNSRLVDKVGERFFTCLDTCHLLTSFKVYKALGLPLNTTLPKVFSDYKTTCKQIHFANVKGFGTRNCHHGIGFQNDVKLMIELLQYIDLYLPGSDIVLEMKETDYYNPVNSVHATNFIQMYRDGKAF